MLDTHVRFFCLRRCDFSESSDWFGLLDRSWTSSTERNHRRATRVNVKLIFNHIKYVYLVLSDRTVMLDSSLKLMKFIFTGRSLCRPGRW